MQAINHVRPVHGLDVHAKNAFRSSLALLPARLVLLRQPNFEALLFQEARQVGVETLFGKGEQRTGEIEFRHGASPRSASLIADNQSDRSPCLPKLSTTYSRETYGAPGRRGATALPRLSQVSD